ncbi:GMC oxidoreductase [Salix suchowensis]|nr:GMC oxidoreductase [Salix suchowensis]
MSLNHILVERSWAAVVPPVRIFQPWGDISNEHIIDYMVYTRGSADDYDRLAAIAGDDGWTWENLHPYILKTYTRYSTIALLPSRWYDELKLHLTSSHICLGHDTTGEFDPAWHGNGPLLTSVAGYPAVIDPLVIGTTQEAAEFPYNVDGNSGNPLGISWVQSTIANGTRQSSAIAYLWPALNRPNLDVLIHTQATRLIQTGRTGATPIFRSVEFATGPSAPRFRATARREVILSAGSVGTPQLLQLSGIGNRETLSALGINTILNNADVGEHLQDHPFIPLQWEVNSNETFDQLFYDADLSAAALNQWNTNHTGPLSTNPVMNHIGFLRIPDDNAIWQENEDPSAGPNSPHYEIAFGNCFVTTSAQTVPSSGGFMTITPIVVSPSSRKFLAYKGSSLR